MAQRISLSDLVLKNLRRLRKSLKIGQDDLGKVLGIGRPAYSKKETGTAPITLDELDTILKNFDAILLEDLFAGLPSFSMRNTVGLSEQAQMRFPALKTVIMLANDLAHSEDPEDMEYFRRTLEHALRKTPIPETIGAGGKAQNG